MAVKRNKTYLVTVEWKYSGKPFRRRIAENAISSKSAVKKVKSYYTHPVMIKKLGRPTIIAVKDY